MRLIWIKVGGLWPANTGGRLRSFQILSQLSASHQVALLTTHRADETPAALEAALPNLVSVVSVPHHVPKQGTAAFSRSLVRSWGSRYPVDLWRWRVGALEKAARGMLATDRWDAVVVDFLVAAPNLPTGVNVPVVYFAHNVEYQIWRRLACEQAAGPKKVALEIEWRKMRRTEHAVVRRADLTIAVSDADRDRLHIGAPAANIHVVPTGVDLDYFSMSETPATPGRLVFSGSMDWYPNEDGVLDFVAGTLPLIRQVRPDASLTVVGRNPGARLRETVEASGATVTGTVPDVRPFVNDAEVYVVPLRVGGGTRLKILEALAMGKAVVSTSIGAEGLGLEDGRELLIADTAAAFAGAVVRLLADPALRRRLGAAGRRHVEQRCSWQTVATSFAGAIERVARVGHAGASAAAIAVS